MKKNILALLFLLFQTSAFSQILGDENMCIIKDKLSKNTHWELIHKWISQSNHIVDYQSEIQGRTILKGIRKGIVFNYVLNLEIKYTFLVDCRDNEYKINFLRIEVHPQPTGHNLFGFNSKDLEKMIKETEFLRDINMLHSTNSTWIINETFYSEAKRINTKFKENSSELERLSTIVNNPNSSRKEKKECRRLYEKIKKEYDEYELKDKIYRNISSNIESLKYSISSDIIKSMESIDRF